jgi:hypothetical protein
MKRDDATANDDDTLKMYDMYWNLSIRLDFQHVKEQPSHIVASIHVTARLGRQIGMISFLHMAVGEYWTRV